MKHFKILCIIIISLNLSCKNAEANVKESEISREELLIRINEFNKAFQKGQVSTLESMITENYVHTNGNSKPINKHDWLSYLRKREVEIEMGNLVVADYEMDEIKIEFHGKMAIVTGRVKVSNKKEEEILINEYRITNIWIIEDGIWKRAGFHDGKIK